MAEDQVRNGSQGAWEREVLEKLVFATLAEQRRSRRWGVFFKSLLIVYVGIVTWLALSPVSGIGRSGGGLHTAVIDVTGVITEGAETSADNLIDGLRLAAKDKATKGIILRMNSPGGSPVQSAYVYEEIRRLKRERPELPIHAVVVDLCASGGYYIAAAADRIFVNGSSMVGSIGVIMNGFGFVDAMGRLGIERRLLTAGEHKAILDPFTPVKPSEKEHIQGMIDHVHRQFIDAVKQGRGDRLKDNPELYSGLIWTGDEGIKLGLVDEIGDVRSVAKDIIGAEEVVDFTPRERLIDRISHRIGASLEHVAAEALARFSGLR